MLLLPALNMARWSSGQDGGLSRPNREFDSPTGHQISTESFIAPYAMVFNIIYMHH